MADVKLAQELARGEGATLLHMHRRVVVRKHVRKLDTIVTEDATPAVQPEANGGGGNRQGCRDLQLW